MKYVFYAFIFIGIITLIFSVILFSLFPMKYKQEIRKAAHTYDIDSALIASVINAESSYRPNAVSKKGAVGLMQIMPETAKWVAAKMDIEFNEDMLKHPQTNILIGTFYLRYLIDKFDDTKTVLIAYNAGEGKVQSWLSQDEYIAEKANRTVLTKCPYPETNRYVEKVLNGRKFYKHRL